MLIGGDFQAARNPTDLTVMSVPLKYRKLGDFPYYYRGDRTAPYLTLFIGGNHEASAYLWELYYGGWVCPNIYYLGAASVVRVGPLRIAGMSGIWKGSDYNKPHGERLPFGPNDIKSFYHVREIDVRKLLLLRTQVDVGMSHDWPRFVERHGDEDRLFAMKRAFRSESYGGTLGNPAAGYVMDRLRPRYWFSAHLHCKFSALKKYPPPGEAAPASPPKVVEPEPAEPQGNPDEIDLDLDDDGPPAKATSAEAPAELVGVPGGAVSEDLRAQLPASFAKPEKREKTTPGQPVPPGITNREVRFLALDKCLPGRHFLQLCEIHPIQHAESSADEKPGEGTDSPRFRLQYDPEWLAITRVFSKYLTIGDPSVPNPPALGESDYYPLIDAELAWVEENLVAKGKMEVPRNFEHTAPVLVDGEPEIVNQQPREYTNPQTAAFCELVGVPNLWAGSEEEREARRAKGPPRGQTIGRRRGGGHDRGRGRGGGWRGRGQW